MKETKTLCPHCSRPMVYYVKTLSAGVVYAAIKFKRAVRFYSRNNLHLKNDLKVASTPPEFKLTDNEWTNMPILREFGIIVHADDKNRKSGYWLLTARGADFLNGKIALPYQIRSYQGHPQGPVGTRMVTIHDFKSKISWFESDFDFEPAGGTKQQSLL